MSRYQINFGMKKNEKNYRINSTMRTIYGGHSQRR